MEVSVGQAAPRELSGIKNNGEVEVLCGDCRRLLMKLLITKTNAQLEAAGHPPVTTKVTVRCGLCGGSSFEHSIEGSFYPGSPDDAMRFEPLEQEGDVVVFRAWKVPQ